MKISTARKNSRKVSRFRQLRARYCSIQKCCGSDGGSVAEEIDIDNRERISKGVCAVNGHSARGACEKGKTKGNFYQFADCNCFNVVCFFILHHNSVRVFLPRLDFSFGERWFLALSVLGAAAFFGKGFCDEGKAAFETRCVISGITIQIVLQYFFYSQPLFF